MLVTKESCFSLRPGPSGSPFSVSLPGFLSSYLLECLGWCRHTQTSMRYADFSGSKIWETGSSLSLPGFYNGTLVFITNTNA